MVAVRSDVTRSLLPQGGHAVCWFCLASGFGVCGLLGLLGSSCARFAGVAGCRIYVDVDCRNIPSLRWAQCLLWGSAAGLRILSEHFRLEHEFGFYVYL